MLDETDRWFDDFVGLVNGNSFWMLEISFGHGGAFVFRSIDGFVEECTFLVFELAEDVLDVSLPRCFSIGGADRLGLWFDGAVGWVWASA